MGRETALQRAFGRRDRKRSEGYFTTPLTSAGLRRRGRLVFCT